MGTCRRLLRIALVMFFVFHPIQTKPLVVVTLYPLADLVNELTGNAIEVYSITPKGVWVHTYIPTSEDTSKTEAADAFIAVGAEEFLSALPIPENALIILDHMNDYGLRINSSRGPHGMWFYAYDLERLAIMFADYLGETFPRLNETVHQNAITYVTRLHEFLHAIADLPKGSVIASFPLISYMCLTFNVTPIGPIMPGGGVPDVKRPIVSFIESKNTPVDDAIRGAAEKLDVPVIYVETFSDDPLSELIRASAPILGASVGDYYLPKQQESSSKVDSLLLLTLIIALLYFSLRDIYAGRTRRRRAQKG